MRLIEPLRQRAWPGACLLLGPLLLDTGCSQTRLGFQKPHVERVAVPEGNDHPRLDRAQPPPTAATASGDAQVRPAALEQPERAPSAADLPAPEPMPSSLPTTPKPPEPSAPGAPSGDEGEEAGNPLPLPEAIRLAFRRQPRLRAFLETIEQARGQKGIAQSLFFPTLGTSYSAGGIQLNSAGIPVHLSAQGDKLAGLNIPGLNGILSNLALPIGINLDTGFELAELHLQWLVLDFGRRLGAYEAARLGIDIAQLQTDRAYQTVANEVAVAYYNVLRTQALRRTGREAVRRAEDQRDVARKLAGGGVLEREQVLRAEVQLAESLRLLDTTEEALGVAYAALNLAIGLKPDEAIGVVEPPDVPEYRPGLRDCMETAIRRRREFQVAQRAVEVAQQGDRVAVASFAPRVVANGTLVDLQWAAPRGYADAALGFITLEWTLFEGGRRIAAKRVADSRVREAMAQAESIANTLAFQVNENYRRLVRARLGIDRARPAVEQARENYRLVRARAIEGDATPSDIIDSQTALTRAEQNYLNSVYDYLSAIAQLEFVMGVTPSPLNQAGR
jgi:outer membrane protein TolC